MNSILLMNTKLLHEKIIYHCQIVLENLWTTTMTIGQKTEDGICHKGMHTTRASYVPKFPEELIW